jgi:hypothetical protein
MPAEPYTTAVITLPNIQECWHLNELAGAAIASGRVRAASGAYQGTPLPGLQRPSLVRSEPGDASIRLGEASGSTSTGVRIPWASGGSAIELSGSAYVHGISVNIDEGLPETKVTGSPSSRYITHGPGGVYELAYRVGASGGVTLFWKTFKYNSGKGGFDTSASLSAAISPGEDHDIYATYDSAETRLYIDGLKVATASGGGVLGNPLLGTQFKTARLGDSATASYTALPAGTRRAYQHSGLMDAPFFADSSIDDATAALLHALWLNDPYQAQIDVLPGRISHWKFDEASGAVADDQEGNNDGAYVGTPQLNVPSLIPLEPASGAVSLAEEGEYVLVADSLSLRLASAFTIGMTIAPQLFGEGYLLSKGVFLDYALEWTQDGRLRVWLRPDGEVIDSIESERRVIDAGGVYNVLATFNGNDLYAYVGGELVASGNIGSGVAVESSTDDLYIGARVLSGVGVVDEASAVFDEVFITSSYTSPETARALHLATGGLPDPDATPTYQAYVGGDWVTPVRRLRVDGSWVLVD